MNGTAAYAEKAAEPRPRLKHLFNDLIVLCIHNAAGLVCSGVNVQQ